jgi:hypothetical protein
MCFVLHSIGFDHFNEACVGEEGNVEFEGVIGTLEEVEAILGDAGGLSCFVEVLGDHFEEGGLSRDAEGVAGDGGEGSAGDPGQKHQNNNHITSQQLYQLSNHKISPSQLHTLNPKQPLPQ